MIGLQRAWDLIWVLTQKELRSRYKNLGLGYLWSLGNPLAYGLVYYFVFKFVMKVKIENFPLFLISALFPWQWFTNSVGVAWITYLGNAPLIKKVNFPRNLLPFVVSVQDMLHFFASLPIIFIFMSVYGKEFSWALIPGIPTLALIQFAYTYSIGLTISSINLFFRDLERIIGVFMTFLFYLTPIVYSSDMIPEGVRRFIFLNPVAPLMMNWRLLFLEGRLDSAFLSASIAYATVLLVISHLVYRKLVWRFAEVL
jgi:lipopolysaccharide transport system permease protein